jgi:hypothetical protein
MHALMSGETDRHDHGQVEWDGEVEQLSWAPRLFLYKRFLSDAECDHLITKVLRHGRPGSPVRMYV